MPMAARPKAFTKYQRFRLSGPVDTPARSNSPRSAFSCSFCASIQIARFSSMRFTLVLSSRSRHTTNPHRSMPSAHFSSCSSSRVRNCMFSRSSRSTCALPPAPLAATPCWSSPLDAEEAGREGEPPLRLLRSAAPGGSELLRRIFSDTGPVSWSGCSSPSLRCSPCRRRKNVIASAGVVTWSPGAGVSRSKNALMCAYGSMSGSSRSPSRSTSRSFTGKWHAFFTLNCAATAGSAINESRLAHHGTGIPCSRKYAIRSSGSSIPSDSCFDSLREGDRFKSKSTAILVCFSPIKLLYGRGDSQSASSVCPR
mmetsp:Transcript_8526/g.20612  ORF Transcript_8526/g.20612 Transcript_8526/m.20612 type:complete len:311 (-) Transcript_8526:389-1321(-)